MKPLPINPFEFQARVMTALCDDLFDIGARRSAGFDRLDALREVSKQSKRQTGPEIGARPHSPQPRKATS